MNNTQGIFDVSHIKFDASLSGGSIGEARSHVLNVALREADIIVKCLQSTFITDAVAVFLHTKPNPFKGLFHWIPSGMWGNRNYGYIFAMLQ